MSAGITAGARRLQSLAPATEARGEFPTRNLFAPLQRTQMRLPPHAAPCVLHGWNDAEGMVRLFARFVKPHRPCMTMVFHFLTVASLRQCVIAVCAGPRTHAALTVRAPRTCVAVCHKHGGPVGFSHSEVSCKKSLRFSVCSCSCEDK